MISTAVAQVDTAENVVHSTARGTEKAARTVAHGVKKAADTVEDAVTPDSDARQSGDASCAVRGQLRIRKLEIRK
jgi:hypothetical protein